MLGRQCPSGAADDGGMAKSLGMSVAAKLTVELLAGDVLVAESEDAKLWQRVLLAVQEGGSDLARPQATAPERRHGRCCGK